MKRGEIRWYKFSKPDKKRPVLILTRDSIIEYLGEVTVAPVTTKIRDIPSELFLSKIENSMKNDCAVNCDHIQTVSKGKIGALITSLSKSEMAQVGKAIEFALDL
ncbi:type II toxin-antitoxin system PemK/MazF family toxin [uncultured Desulfobacter sp.]|uniref:type II toxin-antitoxin system PemK/MazF family toxin n=1 Tax=uncultured Desulfobacter sp. TaxID=240139 RepID=UPI0029F58854|nr:type II toxin-antitoxin system PemK/MazF family toxin [uncultured Desulfobacter sp.]